MLYNIRMSDRQNKNDQEETEKIHGLTSEQVEQYRAAGLANVSVETPTKTVRQIVTGNVFTYFNFVFLIIAGLLIMVQSWRDLTFLPLIIANTLIGIFQELRAKATLDNLIILNAPHARVVRDGKELEVNAEDLVQDDIVVFEAGNQIPADAVVIDGAIAVNESLLTGESDDIKKVKDSELLSGSFVVSGRCYARLTKVGAESYISKLTLAARSNKKGEQSEIIRSLNRIVTLAGIVIIPIGITLFCQQYFSGATLQSSVQSMVGSVLGLIPEGLFLLASVNLALSSMRLAHQKVMLHDMKSIETLARVNILCVDKTGTITSPEMEVAEFQPLDDQDEDDLRSKLVDFANAQAADNITMEALKKYFHERAMHHAKSVIGFYSEFKYSGANFANYNLIFGAPEFVLRDDYKKYKDKIEDYGRRGYRVVVLATYPDEITGEALTKKATPIGLVMFSNPIRQNAPDTFRYFAEQGVQIKVISGDNPVTVSEVAKQAQIEGAENFVDASTLQTEQSMLEAVEKYTVFGRVTPDQKRKFVKLMQSAGNTVAMTGDGVNDVLALRDADCSIAMASGSDAAVQAAQLVLLESDFSRMPEVVAEGRQVVNNLERTGSLFLVKNVFSLITSVLAIGFSVAYPLRAAQISLVSLFTIGTPAFLLSQAPTKDLIRGSFVYNVMRKALPIGLSDSIIVAFTMLFGYLFGLDLENISTVSAVLITILGFFAVYRAAKPRTSYKMVVFFGCLLGAILSYALLPDFFGMSHLHARAVVLCALMIGLIWPTLHLVNNVTDKFLDIVDKYSKKLIEKRKEAFRKKRESGQQILAD